MKRPRPYRLVLIVSLAAYALNWVFTPIFIRETIVEAAFRPHFHEPFHKATWATSGPATPSNPSFGLRYAMVDSLMKSRVLLCKSELAVKALLGDPDSSSKDGSGLHYALAPQPMYPARSILFPFRLSNIDRWHLEIKLEGGIVVATRVYAT